MNDQMAVTIDKFMREKRDQMSFNLMRAAAGINQWHHTGVPTPLDEQTVGYDASPAP